MIISLETVVSIVIGLIVAGLIFGLSSDMRPTLSANDIVHDRETDSVVVRELLHGDATGRVAITNRSHRRFIELGVRVGLTVGHLLLGPGIRHVVGVCPEEQVRGIDAERVITTRAVVADLYVFGNDAMCQFPRQAMSKDVPVADRDPTVTTWISRSCPKPATVSLVDVLPESLEGRAPLGLAEGPCAAKAATVASSGFVPVDLEWAAAMLALKRNLETGCSHDVRASDKVRGYGGGGALLAALPHPILYHMEKSFAGHPVVRLS
jgi:hypothetical protein